VSADVPAAARRPAAAPAGARSLQAEEPARPAGKSGLGIDPGGLLRGIMGR